MKLLPEDDKTAQELFKILGVQGCNCHQLPELIKERKRLRRAVWFYVKTYKACCYAGYDVIYAKNVNTRKRLPVIPLSEGLQTWFNYYFDAEPDGDNYQFKGLSH